MQNDQLHTLPIAIDIVLLSVVNGQVTTLMTRRNDSEIVGGDWALPGALLRSEETPEDTATRVTRDRIGPGVKVHLEQLATFGALNRDPRKRSISIAYLGLLPAIPLEEACQSNDHLCEARLDLSQDQLNLRNMSGQALSIAFDHADILKTALFRLRGKIDYTDVGLSLLPTTFTLRDLQDVWEAVLDRNFSKPPFRRKLLDRNIVEETGEMECGAAHRPAKLYRQTRPE